MRSPARSASTSSSVSKNHALSSTSGSTSRATSPADRLEAALRVGEPGAQGAAHQQVVAARDHLALRPAHHPRAVPQPAADREVGVAADQRRDQRQQRVEVGGQVDVHVDEHVRVGVGPHLLQRPAAALLGEVDDADVVVGVGEPPGQHGGAVGAGVVGDGDAVAPRQRGELLADPEHRRLEVGLLVVDRDHHVERRAWRVPRRAARTPRRSRAGPGADDCCGGQVVEGDAVDRGRGEVRRRPRRRSRCWRCCRPSGCRRRTAAEAAAGDEVVDLAVRDVLLELRERRATGRSR